MSNWGAAAATNVVPLRLSMQALRDGYLELLRALYAPEAFFARMDSMCRETRWLPAPGRTRHLLRNRKYRRWLKSRLRAGAEAIYIFVQLMRHVPEARLRREYRRRIWRAIAHNPNPRLIRVYAMTCAAHFHYDRLIAQWMATPPFVETEPEPGTQDLIAAAE
jgi:hypothetical protein